MIYQLFRAKITKISDKTCIIYTILQNLTIKVLVFPEIYTNFAPKESNFKLRNIIKNLMKMKKYLTMVLAIAISGVFVSCHEDEVSGSLIEQKKIAFEDAFVKAFGQPAPNHNWGFRIPEGDEALTRVADPRGNMWADEGWNVPPVITPEQKDIVRRYFQQNTPLGYNDPGWTDFWIQQVYKGGTKTTDGSKTTEKYIIGNDDEVVGGDHMDHLASRDANGNIDHNNDFNNSDNNDWEGRMLMRSSSTYSFGYINSNATAIHFDKAALVSWRTIAQWAVEKGLETSVEASVLNDGWNRSYMGFDWEQLIIKDCYSSQTFEFEGVTYHYLIANVNQMAYDQTEPTYHGKVNFNDVKEVTADVMRSLLSKGYLPYTSEKKDWIKLDTGADGYYSDWIVTLTEATNSNSAPYVKQVTENPGGYYVTVQEVIESGRVMCEDLAGARFDSKTLDDLDYNDVVYDAVIVDEYKMPCDAEGNMIGNKEEDSYDHRYFATVRLMAAGGTIPVEIVIPDENGDQNFDVHEELEAGDNVMINTLSKDERASVNGALVKDDAEPKTLINQKDGTTKFYGVQYIKNIGLNVFYNHVSIDLTEKYKAATLMFLVPLGTEWAKERVNFATGYPYFPDWVQKPQNVTWYENNIPEYLYDDSELEGLDEDDFNTTSEPIYISGSETFSKTSVPATSTMNYPGGSEKTIFNYAAENAAPGYLCPEVGNEDEEYLTVTLSDEDKTSLAVDQTIRIYGVNIAGWYVTTNISGNEEFNTGSYIDIPVTSSNIDQIKNGITIKGKHFTVTYVTIVSGNSTTPTTSEDDKPSTGGGDGVWTSTSYVNQDKITTTDLNSKGIVKNKAITIKITGTALNWGGPGWGVDIKDIDYNTKVSKTSNNNSELGHFDNSTFNGYVSISVDSSIVNELLDSGAIRIYINMNYTTVEISQ